jgi:hypothetical protein
MWSSQQTEQITEFSYVDRVIREVIKTELHPNNMNRHDGFCLCNHLICSLLHCRSYHHIGHIGQATLPSLDIYQPSAFLSYLYFLSLLVLMPCCMPVTHIHKFSCTLISVPNTHICVLMSAGDMGAIFCAQGSKSSHFSHWLILFLREPTRVDYLSCKFAARLYNPNELIASLTEPLALILAPRSACQILATCINCISCL